MQEIEPVTVLSHGGRRYCSGSNRRSKTPVIISQVVPGQEEGKAVMSWNDCGPLAPDPIRLGKLWTLRCQCDAS